jgi:hypothetical protein
MGSKAARAFVVIKGSLDRCGWDACGSELLGNLLRVIHVAAVDDRPPSTICAPRINWMHR